MVCLQRIKESEMATTQVELKPFLISLVTVYCVEVVIGILAVKTPMGSLSLLGVARTAGSSSSSPGI